MVREALMRRLRSGRGGGGVPPSVERHAAATMAGAPNPLVVNVSARHMHVTPADLEILFGPGAKLTKLKDLYQQGEFASEQLVTLVGPRQRIIPNVRILGPVRDYTQVELSYTDGVYLGIDLPLRISGNHEGTPGITILGPKGAIELPKGVIRAERHVHMSTRRHGVLRRQGRRLHETQNRRPLRRHLRPAQVRYHPKVVLEVHIDTDEGNACDLESATHMELIK